LNDRELEVHPQKFSSGCVVDRVLQVNGHGPTLDPNVLQTQLLLNLQEKGYKKS